jgi:hypothetical protein
MVTTVCVVGNCSPPFRHEPITITTTMDWSSQVTFKEFCDFLQHLVRTKVKANKLNLVKKFLGHWRARLPSAESNSLFPLMRLLLPQLDKERGAYNIKVRIRKYFCLRGAVILICGSLSRRPITVITDQDPTGTFFCPMKKNMS